MPHDNATAHPPQGTLGFRFVGGRHGLRRLVDWQAALAGHAECDPRAEPDRDSYLGAFTFGTELRNHLAETGSAKVYAGPCGAAWLWFDLDDAGEPGRAPIAARRLTAVLVDRYALYGDELLALSADAIARMAEAPGQFDLPNKPGLDSGLPPSEVARQIRYGIEGGRE